MNSKVRLNLTCQKVIKLPWLCERNLKQKHFEMLLHRIQLGVTLEIQSFLQLKTFYHFVYSDMQYIIISNFSTDESFSKLLLGEGSETLVDEDSQYVLELPEWADEKKIKMWVEN